MQHPETSFFRKLQVVPGTLSWPTAWDGRKRFEKTHTNTRGFRWWRPLVWSRNANGGETHRGRSIEPRDSDRSDYLIPPAAGNSGKAAGKSGCRLAAR